MFGLLHKSNRVVFTIDEVNKILRNKSVQAKIEYIYRSRAKKELLLHSDILEGQVICPAI